MFRFSFSLILSLIIVGCLSVSSAPARGTSVLRMEDIMQGAGFVGHLPDQLHWSDDSRMLYFMWNPENADADSLYVYNLRSGSLEKVDAATREALPPRQVVYNPNRSQMLYVQHGDLFLRDVRSGHTTQITNTLQQVSSPAFTADGRAITWVADNNVFLWHRENGQLTQLTDFRQGSARPEGRTSPQEQWLKDQQLDLFEVIRDNRERREQQEQQRRAVQPKRPKTIYTGQARVANHTVCPSTRFVTYSLVSMPQNARNTNVPHFVSESGYTEDQTAYAKVGSPQMSTSFAIFDILRDTVIQVKTADIPGIRDVPDFRRDYGFEDEQLPADRGVMISGPFWSEDGRYAVVNIRAEDNKDRWIMLLDPETGALSLLDRQRDEAWVAGPGIGGRWGGNIGWMPDNRRIWFQSEETGYSHLYTVDVVTGGKKALTSGHFEVYSPQLSHDKKTWYFHSNEVHPGERHFYSMPLEGGRRTQITTMEGGSNVVMSPDERSLAIRFSTPTEPWEVYVMDNKPGAAARRITHSLSDAFMAYDWRAPEVITFPAADGAGVPARLYRPDPSVNNRAAVIFVHGAGYLQNAHKWWSSYFREFMFHNMLVDMGYTVLDIDFRGSAGYGRDWRTGIYRHMGGLDLSDHVDGARFLMAEHGVEPGRIGIYGGSYGGFITLMAMFNHPDVFAAGAALRSVTDWAHYNHGYTSNILNTPVEDSLAYVRSSPIYFAEGLQGALLMCHGMVDDNVHFQDIVRLTQRLIELGKENWELAVYPVERHAFTRPDSWIDEYKRILKLYEDNLRW
jgi:dipeptidyl aminopeptidase/acylaminoacyl peptidase